MEYLNKPMNSFGTITTHPCQEAVHPQEEADNLPSHEARTEARTEAQTEAWANLMRLASEAGRHRAGERRSSGETRLLGEGGDCPPPEADEASGEGSHLAVECRRRWGETGEGREVREHLGLSTKEEMIC